MIVGTIGYDVHSGLGHLVKDFYDNGIIQRVWVIYHPRYQRFPEWYGDDRYGPTVSGNSQPSFINGLTHLLIFENAWNWTLVRAAKQAGVKIVLMPMYEWTPCPLPVDPDLIICPSDLDLEYFDSSWTGGKPNLPRQALYHKGYPCVRLNVPVKQTWRLREKVLTFVHNAGHGQVGFAKGTPEILEAIKLVTVPANFIIRGQPDEGRIQELLKDAAVGFAGSNKGARGTLRIECHNFEDDQLYAEGDVFINAERYNGLSLPLQEAFASGMMVMTTDRFPANTWLPKLPLILPDSYHEHSVNQTSFLRATVNPRDIAERIDYFYGWGIKPFSEAGKKWAEENSWEVLGPKYKEAMESL